MVYNFMYCSMKNDKYNLNFYDVEGFEVKVSLY